MLRQLLPIRNTIVVILISCTSIFAQPPSLGTAGNFVLFTSTGAVGNTGVSAIAGKIGTNNGAINNFQPVPGQQENGNAITTQASSDLAAAYSILQSAVPTFPDHIAVLGNGETLAAGVYRITEAASLNGELILDAQGVSSAVFIIQIYGAFSPAASSLISLTGGALACNVFFAVDGGEIAINGASDVKGNFIANGGAISLGIGGRLEGRLLSTAGAISVEAVQATLPVSCSILPLLLVNFKATLMTGQVELTWTTNNEVAVDRFVIERSGDGNIFAPVANESAVNAKVVTTYHWSDSNPLSGPNFYRLRIVDVDGRMKHSQVIRLDRHARRNMYIYPNPVKAGQVQVQMLNQPKGNYVFSIYQPTGTSISTKVISYNGNDATIILPLATNLAKGTYLLEIIDPNTTRQVIKMFVE